MPLQLPEPPFPWGFRSSAPRHHARRRHFAPVTTFVAPPSVIVVAPASEAVASVTYEPAPVAAPAPGAIVPAATVLPTPTLVDFPTGWYQLRGDGVRAPYTWVWIPKPPAAPAVTEMEAPRAAPEPRDAPRPREAAGPAYHWTDDGGVTTWTNRLDRVPKRFRGQAARSIE